MERQRKIIHGDCDCFFAAVEMRDDPSLIHRPIAIGGSSDRRGVISTCNYIARSFGVRSAMATAHAVKLCPNLVVLPHNMSKYREASQQVKDIFLDYSPLVEPLSLDEAYIDVSDATAYRGSATRIAEAIRQRVREEVGITLSAGVAPNKFLAKVASDWNKPDGQFVILPSEVDEFVANLPVERLSGVGKVTASKLHARGIERCGDLRRYSVFELSELFGRFGARLHELAWGRDDRPVRASRERKSLSVEHTYATDLDGIDVCEQALSELFQKLLTRLADKGIEREIVGQQLKLKFSDFQTTTVERRQRGVPRLSVYLDLLREGLERSRGRGVRLLGLGVRLRSGQEAQQLPLFE